MTSASQINGLLERTNVIMSITLGSTMAITFGSFNCNGFKNFEPSLDQLLNICDILCLQELMLTKQECCTLNAIRHNCYGYGVSPTGGH